MVKNGKPYTSYMDSHSDNDFSFCSSVAHTTASAAIT